MAVIQVLVCVCVYMCMCTCTCVHVHVCVGWHDITMAIFGHVTSSLVTLELLMSTQTKAIVMIFKLVNQNI